MKPHHRLARFMQGTGRLRLPMQVADLSRRNPAG